MLPSPSDRISAGILLAAAAAGLLAAASPLGPALIGAQHAPLLGGLDAQHLIAEGLLALFFLLVAIELRHELTRGALAHPAAAIVPAIAAVGGVVAPAAVYLLLAGPDAARGWPIPVATDIAFALGLLALVGRRFPPRVRAFLLALAIVDDLIAVLLIAVVFPHGVDPVWLLPAAALVGVVAVLTRLRLRPPIVAAVVVAGLLVWLFALRAGVHATLAGVACGLVLPDTVGDRVDRALQPVSRLVVLPLFAFSASLVPVTGTVTPVLVPVAVALPLGKVVGIVAGGLVGGATVGRRAPTLLRPAELVAVGLLGGIGFTVSLLMAQLAFDGTQRDAATIGVLVGSSIAILLSAGIVPLLARRSSASRNE